MPYHVGKKGSYGCSGFPALKEDGTVMGCHKTRSAAAGQIYAINRSEGNIGKSMITEGNFVMFKEGEDEVCVGRVEYVMRDPGVLGLADSEYAVTSTADDYGVLIRVYEEEDGVWEEEDKLVTRNMSELTPVGPLMVERDVVVPMGESVSEEQYKAEEVEKQAPCWDGYVQRGMKPGENGRMVPNCVPVEKSIFDGFGKDYSRSVREVHYAKVTKEETN